MNITELERIEVYAHFLGFEEWFAKLIVEKTADGSYQRRHFAIQSYGEPEPVAPELLEAVLEALARPLVPALNGELMGMPQQFLDNNYWSGWFDDYPELLIRVLTQTDEISIWTDTAQDAYLLPLKIQYSRTADRQDNWDPRVSRALADLLPDAFLEKQRLGGRDECLQERLNSYLSDTSDKPAQGTATSAEEAGACFDGFAERFSQLELRSRTDSEVEEWGQAQSTGRSVSSIVDDCIFAMVSPAGDLSARSCDGRTGLHMVCGGGSIDLATSWVEAGADIEARTPQGVTPVMLGVAWPEILSLLVERGANLNAVDKDGHNALVYLIHRSYFSDLKRTHLSLQTLLDGGLDINRLDNQGRRPLYHARLRLGYQQLQEEFYRVRHQVLLGPDSDSDVDPSVRAEVALVQAFVDALVAAGAVE